MKLPELTPEEQHALVDSMSHSFGPCTCRTVNGQHMWCDGHRFLGETQVYGGELRDRVSIMVMLRRGAHVFTTKEFGRPFVLEPAVEDPLPADLLGPPREQSTPPVPGSPQQGDDSGTLPW